MYTIVKFISSYTTVVPATLNVRASVSHVSFKIFKDSSVLLDADKLKCHTALIAAFL